MKKAEKSLIALLMAGVFTLTITPSLKTNAAYTRQLSNYPTYHQVGENCWAYAILSMANFSYGGYSINNIYDAFSAATGNPYDYNGANVDEALKVIRYIYSGYNSVKKGQLSSNEIKMEINSNYPVYIRGDGHAVALMGYRAATASSSVSLIYYMNSATGSIMFSGYEEGTENTFYTDSNQVFNWVNSIIIDG